MKQLKLAIVTDDSAYGEALVRGLRYRSRSFSISLHSCGGFTAVWKTGGLGFRKGYDLILWDGEDGERIKGDNIMWITDRVPQKLRHSRCGDEDYTVYRYDTASSIHGRIMDVCAHAKGGAAADISPESGCAGLVPRIIAFGSWQGGSGCTTLCRALAQELTRFFGKRILWISLDGIEPEGGAHSHGEEESGRGVDRLLYRILDGDGSGAGRKESDNSDIEAFIARDGYGVMSLIPSMGRNPLPYLSSGEVEKVLASLGRSELFDAILIDGGDCCSEAAAAFMGEADRICLLGRGRIEDSAERKERYYRWIGNVLPDGSEDRIMTIEDMDEMGRPDREVLLEGEFGKNIHALAEALWYNEIDTSIQ